MITKLLLYNLLYLSVCQFFVFEMDFLYGKHDCSHLLLKINVLNWIFFWNIAIIHEYLLFYLPSLDCSSLSYRALLLIDVIILVIRYYDKTFDLLEYDLMLDRFRHVRSIHVGINQSAVISYLHRLRYVRSINVGIN